VLQENNVGLLQHADTWHTPQFIWQCSGVTFDRWNNQSRTWQCIFMKGT